MVVARHGVNYWVSITITITLIFLYYITITMKFSTVVIYYITITITWVSITITINPLTPNPYCTESLPCAEGLSGAAAERNK